MTLVVIDPSSAAVVNHPGGVISVRCADYPGAARASLTTPADTLAAAGGDVVRDEQGIAVQTTFTSVFTRWGLAADSVVIPLGDLNREASVHYQPFISLRMEGEPPSNAQARRSVFAYDVTNGAGLGVAYGVGPAGSPSMYGSFDWMANHLFEHYILRSFDNTGPFSSDTDSEELVIRAWGITGGDVAIFLDTLYLVPQSGDFTEHEYQTIFPVDGALAFFQNGVLWRDNDNDASGLPFGSGKFSVLPWQMPWAPDDTNWGQVVDFQTADDEPTATDINGFGTWAHDPRSRLVIPVGASFAEAVTLMEDDFAISQVNPLTEDAKDIGQYALRELGIGVNSGVTYFWDSPATTRRGMFVEAGDGFATCYFGNTTGVPTEGSIILPDGSPGWYGHVSYGTIGVTTGVSATDPRNWHPWYLPHLECFTASCRGSMIDVLGQGSVNVGMRGDNLGDVWCLARLEFQPSGDVELSLWWHQSDHTSVESYFFANPVTVGTGYTEGDWWWVKVEKRGYWWRARAWADGDTEPTTWDVEGAQPLIKQTTGKDAILYPWDDNWEGDTTNDTTNGDPRGGPLGLADDHGHLFVSADQAGGQVRMRILVDDYSAEYAPGAETPGDIHLRVEKYDGSVDYGTVTIPWGAHRLVRAGLAWYTFNADGNGINIRVWKDSGPDFMTAGLGRVLMRAPLRLFRPQIYRRVLG